MAHHASYLYCIFDRKSQDRAMRWIRTTIKKYNLEFDGFIVSGVSGITMGSIAARNLRKDLVICRKTSEEQHSNYSVENYKPNRKYIFLDDLISTGYTYNRVAKQLSDMHATLQSSRYVSKDSKESEIIGKMLYFRERYYSL